MLAVLRLAATSVGHWPDAQASELPELHPSFFSMFLSSFTFRVPRASGPGLYVLLDADLDLGVAELDLRVEVHQPEVDVDALGFSFTRASLP